MDGDIVYLPAPESVEAMHREKLGLTIDQLLKEKKIEATDGGTLLQFMSTDKNIKSKMIIKIALWVFKNRYIRLKQHFD